MIAAFYELYRGYAGLYRLMLGTYRDVQGLEPQNPQLRTGIVLVCR